MAQLFFYLLILLLPVQLGYHFWPKESFVWGIKIDYLAPTIYLTDILVFLIIFSWIIEKRKTCQLKKIIRQHYLWLIVLGFLVVNCLLAKNQLVAFYGLMKIMEMGLLVLYVKNTVIPSFFSVILSGAKNPQRNLERAGDPSGFALRMTLSVSVFYTSVIAIIQFIKQGSIGGVLWFLGERTFTASTPGISQIDFMGRLLLRSYATFPHPNVLAGFLVLSLTILLFELQRELLTFGSKNKKLFSIVYLVVSIFGFVALILTFSRTAILAFLIIISIMILSFFKKKILKILFLIFLASCFIILTSKISSPESLTYRIDLNNIAIKMIKDHPIFGVGLNNFIPAMVNYVPPGSEIRLLQPVHNIYLLIVSEVGLVGLILLILFELRIMNYELRREKSFLFILHSSFFIILFLGLFDHYWLTLQQGQIMLALIIGFSLRKCYNK